MALVCEFKCLSDQPVPKHLREYLKSLGFERAQVQGDPEGALNNVLDRSIDGLSGWTRRQSPLKDRPAHGACGTSPCDPGGTDAYLAKRCGEEVRGTRASAPSDSGMARQTLRVVA